MSEGSAFPSERSTFSDSETGVPVHRLTNALCHSNHLYFTHRGWYAEGRRMLFHSDRGSARNLFGLDLGSGEIMQITGFQDGGPSPFHACVNPARDEAYFWANRTLYGVDLATLREWEICSIPDGFMLGMPSCTADGRYVCCYLDPDLRDKLPVDSSTGSVPAEVYMAAHPRCRIIRVPTQGGEAETVHEEDEFIGHVNTSPTEPNLLTFCHEGPWPLVAQRMWGLDLRSGRAWKIRPETEGVVIGHEYWFADGSRVGYHGRLEDTPVWGHADPLGEEFAEYPLSKRSMHLHSLGAELLVSDGSAQDPYLRVWRWNGESYEGRTLCRHRCSFHTQRLHVHPAMTPDGTGVVFTSDMNGYGNVYQVEIPLLESLPLV